MSKWRHDCHEKIGLYFEQKCQELDRFFNEQVIKDKGEIERTRLKIAELIHQQETTRQDIDTLTSTICQLKRNMEKIEQTSFSIHT